MLQPRTVDLKRAKQGAKPTARVGLELERRPAVWARRARVEKGIDLLLEEVSLEGTEELFGLGQAQPEMLYTVVVLVEGEDIGDGFFVTVVVTHDELQFDTHTGASPGSSDRGIAQAILLEFCDFPSISLLSSVLVALVVVIAARRLAPVIPDLARPWLPGTVQRHTDLEPHLPVLGRDKSQRLLDAVLVRGAGARLARLAPGFLHRLRNGEDVRLSGMDVARWVIGHEAKPADILGLLVPFQAIALEMVCGHDLPGVLIGVVASDLDDVDPVFQPVARWSHKGIDDRGILPQLVERGMQLLRRETVDIAMDGTVMALQVAGFMRRKGAAGGDAGEVALGGLVRLFLTIGPCTCTLRLNTAGSLLDCHKNKKA
jgi:hypothetical protein